MRATILSVAANIALKFLLVWGLDFGVVGIALGTSLAAWVNLGLLALMARQAQASGDDDANSNARSVHRGRGSRRGRRFLRRARISASAQARGFHDEIAFAIAALLGAAAYATVVIALRRNLPLSGAMR